MQSDSLRRWPLLIAVSCLTLFVLGSSATVRAAGIPSHTYIGDTFTTGDGTGTVGNPINGVNTEVGGVTWTTITMFYGADDAAHTSGPTTWYNAVVPFTPSTGAPLRLQADVRSVGDFNSNDWLAIGFFDSTAPANLTSSFAAHELWVLVSQAGNYAVLANGATHTLSSGAAPNYDPNGLTQLVLDYDPASNSAALRINGTSVALSSNLNTYSYTPSIAHVGFTMLRQTTSGQLDNFALIIPEPASACLLGLGSVALIRRRR